MGSIQDECAASYCKTFKILYENNVVSLGQGEHYTFNHMETNENQIRCL